MRLFLAAELPDDVRDGVVRAAAPLRELLGDRVAWTAPERVHLTLKFLGEQPEDALPPLAAMLDRIAARHSDVPLEIGGVGAFPSLRRPRVLWMGIAPHPRLELLQHDVEEGCAALGHEVEGRAFRPHLTLGRVRERLGVEDGRALARAARRVNFRAAADVGSIVIMQSHLSSAGARYRVLHSSPLRAT